MIVPLFSESDLWKWDAATKCPGGYTAASGEIHKNLIHVDWACWENELLVCAYHVDEMKHTEIMNYLYLISLYGPHSH